MAEDKDKDPTRGQRVTRKPVGRRVWCAYMNDGSGFVLFGQEMQAMRYALEHHMDGARPVEFGVPLIDQVGRTVTK